MFEEGDGRSGVFTRIAPPCDSGAAADMMMKSDESNQTIIIYHYYLYRKDWKE